MTEFETKVAIVVVQSGREAGVPLVFDIEAIRHLRNLGIAGILTGTLPSATQQNAFLSIPLRLMAEEAIWLVENEFAFLVPGENTVQKAVEKSGTRELEEARVQLEESFAAQRKYKQQQHMEKLQKLGFEGESCDARLLESSLFVETQDSSTLVSRDQHDFDNRDTQTRLLERLRAGCKHVDDVHVYRDLKAQGYFLSPGGRFGGRFIAYPGDPLRYHSHMTVQPAMDYENEPLDLLQVVSGGRLGTGVKKLWVVGGVMKEETEKEKPETVEFFSIEWAGFG